MLAIQIFKAQPTAQCPASSCNRGSPRSLLFVSSLEETLFLSFLSFSCGCWQVGRSVYFAFYLF